MKMKISISKLGLIILLIAAFAVCGLAQKSESFECVRATPEPIIKKEVYPQTTFVLQKNKSFPFNDIGFETVKFRNGDKLTIEHSGCENYTLIFRFETSRYNGKPADARFWYKKAVQLMQQAKKGFGSNNLIDRGMKALNSYIKNNRTLRFAKEISFGGEVIRDVVFFNQVKKRKGNRYEVELSFGIGPL